MNCVSKRYGLSISVDRLPDSTIVPPAWVANEPLGNRGCFKVWTSPLRLCNLMPCRCRGATVSSSSYRDRGRSAWNQVRYGFSTLNVFLTQNANSCSTRIPPKLSKVQALTSLFYRAPYMHARIEERIAKYDAVCGMRIVVDVADQLHDTLGGF